MSKHRVLWAALLVSCGCSQQSEPKWKQALERKEVVPLRKQAEESKAKPKLTDVQAPPPVVPDELVVPPPPIVDRSAKSKPAAPPEKAPSKSVESKKAGPTPKSRGPSNNDRAVRKPDPSRIKPSAD